MINLKNIKKTAEPSELEIEVSRLFAELKNHEPNTNEYNAVADQLKKLYPLKEIDSKRRVSPDAVLGAVVNLAGIALVLNFEHAHALTSKALGMVGRKFIG
ncbi:hypothetical protein SEA_CRICKO_29 [Streptomyces phage CricKo]|nr:hypothetical protein SEA_RAINYDAI_29 [Streptomyces phage Rainydai]AWN06130.1 hypothetical protein SEA_SENDITCS_27 [Streptomyces phage SendItCS]QJD49912.1 hypothetical protein SEA_CRICKO_29 [Streptomyces phage CricKo]QNL30644.1 hypothetical protein SEA_THIQQUMS_29 [Streptomyces phage Thiqqums]WIC89365.1 hypothetical protein SEA_MIEK_28 [Streptomyces phage Miek]